MSRIGKTPISAMKDVQMDVSGKTVTVRGPKGSLSMIVPTGISILNKDGTVTIESKGTDGSSKALHGCMRAVLFSMMKGVTQGWTKTLELVGVGYRAVVTNGNLVLTIGFSHPVMIAPPEGISFAVAENKIIVSGIDKQIVGQIASDIRSVRKPEPYKGKGIRYQGEHVRKKAGKTAKAIGGTSAGK